MKHHPLSVFFVLAFLLPWLVWGTSIAEGSGLIDWHVPQSLAFWLGLPIATYVAAAVTGGWNAVKDLLLRMIRVRVSVRWYVIALVATPGFALVAIGIGILLAQPPEGGAIVVGSIALSLLFNIWMWLITEETAWRGFALPRLQRRYNPLVASILLGIVWGLWHLPLFLIPGTFQSTIPFVGFLISTIATSVFIGWIFNGARGSVLLAAVFHGVTDVTIGVAAVMSSGAFLFWIFIGIQLAAAAVVAPGLSRMSRSV